MASRSFAIGMIAFASGGMTSLEERPRSRWESFVGFPRYISLPLCTPADRC